MLSLKERYFWFSKIAALASQGHFKENCSPFSRFAKSDTNRGDGPTRVFGFAVMGLFSAEFFRNGEGDYG